MTRKSELSRLEMRNLYRKMVARILLMTIFLGLLIFLPAGTFDFWQVYVYFAVLYIPMFFVLFYFLKTDPRFLERRAKLKEKESQQMYIIVISSVIFFSGFLIPGFDHRFGWSGVPVFIVIIADFVVLLGYLFIFFVFKQNSYASRIIEVSEGQQVISTGLYRIVRHPMYLGVLIMYMPTPVALGSYWALIPFAFLPVFLVFRILNEEKVLSEKLPGYKEYCLKTRFRLIPYIW